MEMTTFFQNHMIETATVVKYVGDILAKGVASGAGKDLWEKIKSKAKKSSEEKVVVEFESNPKDERVQGKIEALFESWLESDSEYKEGIVKILDRISSEDKVVTTVSNSKNVVANSSIKNIKGDFRIGDNFESK